MYQTTLHKILSSIAFWAIRSELKFQFGSIHNELHLECLWFRWDLVQVCLGFYQLSFEVWVPYDPGLTHPSTCGPKFSTIKVQCTISCWVWGRLSFWQPKLLSAYNQFIWPKPAWLVLSIRVVGIASCWLETVFCLMHSGVAYSNILKTPLQVWGRAGESGFDSLSNSLASPVVSYRFILRWGPLQFKALKKPQIGAPVGTATSDVQRSVHVLVCSWFLM